MFWEEKINLAKKNFSPTKFKVPHVKRKEILKKIETKFIKRPENYYDANNAFYNRFSNWWENLKSPFEKNFSGTFEGLLDTLLEKNQHYWVAFEFKDHILIYKATPEVILFLSSIAQTWTKTFHVIDLKYNFLIGIKLLDSGYHIKAIGDNLLLTKIKAHF